MLNSYQIPPKLYGDKSAGNKTVSGIEDLSSTRKSCSGTSGNNYVTVSAGDEASYSAGDQVLIHQSRGSNADQTTTPNWEFNEVTSTSSGQINLLNNLSQSYVDSGASQAQIIKCPMWNTVTLPNGATIAPSAWDGNISGIEVIIADVFDGQSGGTINLNNLGFRAGQGTSTRSLTGEQGEGTAGAGGTRSTAANGSGAGGGQYGTAGDPWASSGGGGGHATAGDNGFNSGDHSRSSPGTGGVLKGNAGLTIIVLGGGGAAGGTHGDGGGGSPSSGAGGKGAAILIIFARSFTNLATINLGGVNGQNIQGSPPNAVDGAGGGGSGGASLICGNIVDIGTNLITAPGGTGGTTGSSNGGNGSAGRTHVEYGTSLTGSTNNPTADTEQNNALKVFSPLPSHFQV